jgi:NAD(P)H-dependent FMN reductase
MLDLLVVAGSIRENGYSPRVARLLAECLREEGAAVREYDIRVLPMLGTFPPREPPPIVEEWRRVIRESHGIAWVVPTYHNSLPGVTKNALDLVGADHMSGQVNVIVGASRATPGVGATATANVIRTIGGRLPMQDLNFPAIHELWGREPEPATPEIAERLRDFGRNFIQVVQLFRGER